MTMITSESLSPSAGGREETNFFAEICGFWRQFFAHPYRPELHYMRGPGPACRAKQAAALRRRG